MAPEVGGPVAFIASQTLTLEGLAPETSGHPSHFSEVTVPPGITYSGVTDQGVVTCVSHVEVFATGIKIESSDQSLF